jgi:hypothetical protein
LLRAIFADKIISTRFLDRPLITAVSFYCKWGLSRLNRKNMTAWGTVAAVVIAGAGVWMFRSNGGEDLKAVPAEALIARIEAGSPQDQVPVARELASRGEAALPRILTGFTQSQSKPQVQESLAESVYRMPPTLQTVNALEQMARQAAGTEAGERIRMLYAEVRLRCPETRSRPPEQEQP